MSQGLKHGPIETAIHLCVDMQVMFARDTEWQTPWMDRVLPEVVRIAEVRTDATIFTRFVPAARPGDGHGSWKQYYERWASMTLDRLRPDMVELVPELARLVPPAETLDKRVYSPWLDTDLEERLRRRGARTLVVTGGETDVCVLASVLGAVDRGYRVIIPHDCLCSSSDQTHDALLTLYRERYGQQVEVASAAEIIESWAPSP